MKPRTHDWDVVVAGAGPAGSAAALGALRADPRLRVLLLDREDFPRDKSCGDGIAPHVVDLLAELEAGDVVDGWRPVRRLALRRGDVGTARSMARDAFVVPRAVFDERLVRHAVRAGAVLRRRRVRTVRAEADGVAVDGCRGALLVGADGAHSTVRAAAGLAPVPRRALAIRGYAPTPPAGEGEQRIVFGDRRQPSYAWAFDRGDGLSNVGYGELLGGSPKPPTRRMMLEELDRLLPGAATSGDDWRAHHLPLSGWRWRQPDGRLLLAGDAAGLVNPMTGEGIYYAVATGLLAGRAAALALGRGTPEQAGALHRGEVRRLLARHLRHTSVISRLAALPSVVDAGLRAGARDQSVFDDIVEIGLGRGLLTPRLVGGLARSLAQAGRPGTARTPSPTSTR